MARILAVLATLALSNRAHGYQMPTASSGLRRRPLLTMAADLSPSEAPLSRRSWALGVGTAMAAGSIAVSPQSASAAATIDPSGVRQTKGGAKCVVVKEGGCPKADFTGMLGSCEPRTGSICIIDYTGEQLK